LSARFLAEGVPDSILTKYHKRIVEQFLPKRGEGKLDLRSARRTIRDYRKATSDLAGTVDLMLTYVESGTEFTNRFGDALSTATSTSLSTTASNPYWMKWSACSVATTQNTNALMSVFNVLIMPAVNMFLRDLAQSILNLLQ
jgi:hypothetical protein